MLNAKYKGNYVYILYIYIMNIGILKETYNLILASAQKLVQTCCI